MIVHLFYRVPASGPSVIAMFVGVAVFAAAVWAKKRAFDRHEPVARSLDASRIGVILQGLAMGLAPGPFRLPHGWFGLDRPGNLIAVIALMTMAAGLFVWASGTMGQNWSLVARARRDHQLVTTGPFAYVRHPIYVAMLALLVGMGLATGHGRTLRLILPLFALGTWIRVVQEEAVLRAHFGAAYDAYGARVARFLPWLL